MMYEKIQLTLCEKHQLELPFLAIICVLEDLYEILMYKVLHLQKKGL